MMMMMMMLTVQEPLCNVTWQLSGGRVLIPRTPGTWKMYYGFSTFFSGSAKNYVPVVPYKIMTTTTRKSEKAAKTYFEVLTVTVVETRRGVGKRQRLICSTWLWRNFSDDAVTVVTVRKSGPYLSKKCDPYLHLFIEKGPKIRVRNFLHSQILILVTVSDRFRIYCFIYFYLWMSHIIQCR